MNPRASFIVDILGNGVGALPVAFGVVPQSEQGCRYFRRKGRGEGGAEFGERHASILSTLKLMRSALGPAWLAMTIALAAHVADEALTDFLSVYNPIVTSARERWPWFPMPTFDFAPWLGGLIAGIVLLLLLAPLAFQRAPLARALAYPLAIVIGLLNGMGHLLGSLYFRRWLPGTTTAPILLVCGAWLLTVAVISGNPNPNPNPNSNPQSPIPNQR